VSKLASTAARATAFASSAVKLKSGEAGSLVSQEA